MAVNINTILNWFKTGERPTQSQFWDTWQSFWHKEESIPQNKIENLETTFNAKANKASTLTFQDYIPTSADLNDYMETGYYFQRITAGAAGGFNYPAPYAGKLQVVANMINSDTEFVYQVYHVFGPNETVYYRNYYHTLGWSDWKRVNSARKDTILSGADLNTYTETGVYFQNSNAAAIAGSNYPIALAGKLEVQQSTNSSLVYQTYHSYGPNNDQYIRTKYGSSWYAWKKVVTTSI
ncbi:hypothetical protein FUA48_14065 [Flavobacterium alkalisoli]|uniref:Uncharacterized protein n=1 Tax=Flavobacterium alkalisoli TaxID=2602769 RepID=A0A5B9G052_9FLAO|nr:pyocin knob domain-containing protein [Flavobacterium alkalisoli]QEE50662.1 hypothetical protein FUA48_14065 [Flavobacterium alkalisoli]